MDEWKNYYVLKKYNRYVSGIVGTDFELSFWQKLRILFSPGISVMVGDVFPKEDM